MTPESIAAINDVLKIVEMPDREALVLVADALWAEAIFLECDVEDDMENGREVCADLHERLRVSKQAIATFLRTIAGDKEPTDATDE